MRQLRYEYYRIFKSLSTIIVSFLFIVAVMALAFFEKNVSMTDSLGAHNYLNILGAAGFALILPSIIVAQAITNEFKDNAIITTLILFPQRLKTVFVKWLAAISVVLLLMVVASLAIIALAVIKDHAGYSISVVLVELGRTFLAAVAVYTMVFAFGLIVKQTAIAVVVPTVLIGLVEGLLSMTLKVKSNYLLSESLQTFSTANSGEWKYLLVYCVYVALFICIGLFLFKKRDF